MLIMGRMHTHRRFLDVLVYVRRYRDDLYSISWYKKINRSYIINETITISPEIIREFKPIYE